MTLGEKKKIVLKLSMQNLLRVKIGDLKFVACNFIHQGTLFPETFMYS